MEFRKVDAVPERVAGVLRIGAGMVYPLNTAEEDEMRSATKHFG